MKSFWKFFSFILLINSCKKDSPPPIFSASDFPLKTGNYWTYQFTSYTYNLVIDTIVLKVQRIDSIAKDSDLVYIYIYNNNDVLIDSGVYNSSKNGMTYKGLVTQYPLFGDFRVILPFTQGNAWINSPTFDTLKVISYSNEYLVPPDSYSAVFYLYSNYRGNNYLLINEIYFSKGIGIIHKNIQYQDNNNYTNNRTESYDLIGYHLN